MQNLTTVFSSANNQILSFGHGPGKILILVPVPVKFSFGPVPVSKPAKFEFLAPVPTTGTETGARPAHL
jgi:hypothetical protein